MTSLGHEKRVPAGRNFAKRGQHTVYNQNLSGRKRPPFGARGAPRAPGAGWRMGRQAGFVNDAPWQVYIVECADRTLYTGIARDLGERISSHNAGRGARYTRGRGPVRLVYAEPAPDRSAAQRREHAIKRLSLSAKRRLIAAGGDK